MRNKSKVINNIFTPHPKNFAHEIKPPVKLPTLGNDISSSSSSSSSESSWSSSSSSTSSPSS